MNKISENKVKELITELKGMSSLKDGKRKKNYWYVAKQNIVNSNNISTELIKQFLDEYLRIKKNKVVEDVETDDKAITALERDENGNIEYYYFEIYRKDSPTLTGRLDRKEMETIFRLYSIYGSNLTQKIVSREFPQYTFIEFKRILKAFNIYKASSEFPQHLIEEKTEEELIQLHNQNKENNVLRRLEKDQLTEANKLINKLAKENQELKKQQFDIKELSEYLISLNIDLSKNISVKNVSNDSDLVIVLSDLHIGALNEKYGYIQLEDYNESEINRRLNKILKSISSKTYNSITVCNLGDSLDSYNRQTSRGGHELPTLLSNKEQSKLFLKIMLEFFNNLILISPKISYISVGESNHDADWGWINNIVLASKLKELFNIESYISDNPIDKFDINDTSIIYLHGKDNKNQFKGFPLVLDFKTESWFNSYFIDSGENFKKKKCIIKGDLHQYAYSCAKHFDYISAPSLYGSSNWISANFGKTPWGVLLLEIDSFNNIKNYLVRD